MEETKGHPLVNDDNSHQIEQTIVIENVENPELIILEKSEPEVLGIKIVLADYYICSSICEDPSHQVSNESDYTSIPIVIIENETRDSQHELETIYTFDSAVELHQPFIMQPNEGDKTSNPENILDAKKVAEIKKHKCKYCMKCFKRKNSLNRHLRLHTGERPYKCIVCERSFIEKGALVVHLRIHTGERPYSCSQCKKTFRHRSNMKAHEIRHFKDKRYLCLVCKKKFITPGNWKKHLRTHSSDKDYTRKEPFESFKTQKVLIEHRAPDKRKLNTRNISQRSPNDSSKWMEHSTNHIDARRLHRCNVCSKLFCNPASLKVHMNTHINEKPYKCTVCLKGFARHFTLRKHMDIHTGIKPHKCQICQKTFTGSFTLKLHIRTHTGEKPYHCDICGRKFSQKSNLKRHQRTRHDTYY